MSSKVDAFWAAREMLMMEVDRENDAIRHKFDAEVANNISNFAKLPEIPEFIKGPTVEEIIYLAKKINEFLDPSPNKPCSTKLLNE